MAKRNCSDEHYIIDLIDDYLGLKVDAYYPGLCLVVEYHERQHRRASESF